MRGIAGRIALFILAATLIGSIFWFQTNTRSSIMIKEAIYVGGTALALLAASVHLIVGGKVAFGRLSLMTLLIFLGLMAWMLFRHHAGTISVNGPKYMLSTFSLGALAFLGASLLDERSRSMLLWILIVSASLVCIYAIITSLGMTPFKWDAGVTRSARSSGTMGNANLMGSFAMAVLPVGAGFLLSRLRLSKLRYLFALLFCGLCTWAVFASKTRGSLAGLVAILLFVPFVPSIRRNRRTLIAVLLVLLVLIGSSVLLLGSRMAELFQTGSGTPQVRKLIWSGTVAMIMSNPVLGYGPGSFQIVFPGFRDPSYFILGVSHNTLHAHCEYLEILGDTGLVGLMLWGALAFAIIRSLRKNRTGVYPDGQEEEAASRRWLALGISGGIIALLAEGTVSVALRWPPSALLMGLFAGLLLSCIPSAFKRPRAGTRIPAAASMLAAAVFLGAYGIPEYISSMRSGRELFVGKEMYLEHISRGMNNAMSSAEEWGRSGNEEALNRAVGYLLTARSLADSSVTWCRRCVETDPDDLGGWYALGSAYVTRARLYQHLSPQLTALLVRSGIEPDNPERTRTDLSQGLAAYNSLRMRAPDYAEVHNNLALIWVNLGEPDSALASMRRAWDLHVHNRRAYAERLRFLTPLSRSMDGVHLKLLLMTGPLMKMETGRGLSALDNSQLRNILFDIGTVFCRHHERADSLRIELLNILDPLEPGTREDVASITAMQVERIPEGMELLERLGRGDTAGVMRDLEDLAPEHLEILPIHGVIEGSVKTLDGDIGGMRSLSRIIGRFGYGVVDNLDVPFFDMERMLHMISGALLRTGLETEGERELFLHHLSNMLILDMTMYELLSFIDSSFELALSSAGERDQFMSIWETVGGPLYRIIELGDEGDHYAFMAGGALMEEAFSRLRSLSSNDPLNTDLILLEIAWLYMVQSSAEHVMPRYAAGELTSMMAAARLRLEGLRGDSETQYMISTSLRDMVESGSYPLPGLYSDRAETLRNDLVLGRLPGPDLP